jgi:hypothetical protein
VELGSLLGQVRDRTFRYAEDILQDPRRLSRAIRRKA